MTRCLINKPEIKIRLEDHKTKRNFEEMRKTKSTKKNEQNKIKQNKITKMSEEISEIISARWVITVNPKKEIFENHSLLISHEKIHSLLPTPLALSQYPNTKHTNLSDRHALIPGLINMHTHTAMSLLRAVSEGLDLHQWLQKCIWPLEKEFVSEEYVNDAMEIGCHEMIRQGQTCINDMYFFPNVSAEVVDRIGFRACLGMPIIGFPTNYSVDGFEAIEKVFLFLLFIFILLFIFFFFKSFLLFIIVDYYKRFLLLIFN